MPAIRDSQTTPTEITPLNCNPDASVLEKVFGPYGTEPAFLVWVQHGTDGKSPCDPTSGLMTAPNSARDRAVLTLAEAIEAAAKLRDAGMHCGVGFLPSRLPGVAALDLDKCVRQNGNRKIDDWALEIVGDNYAEYSPSGSGLRCLIDDSKMDQLLVDRSNGLERAQLGIYGQHSNRFVTLTGQVIEGASTALTGLAEAQEHAIIKRWATDPGAIGAQGQFVGLYEPGQAGMDQALLDITTGEALHPATIAFAAIAANTMTQWQVEEMLHIAFLDSAAKDKEPGRWHARYPKSIEGAIEWINGLDGFRKEVTTQQRQAAKALFERFQPQVDGSAPDLPPKPAPQPPEGETWTVETYIEKNHCVWHGWPITPEEEAMAMRQLKLFNYDGGRSNFNKHIHLPEYLAMEEWAESPLGLCSMDKSDIGNVRAATFVSTEPDAEAVRAKSHLFKGNKIFDDYAEEIDNTATQAALDDLRNPEQDAVPTWVVDDAPSKVVRDIADHIRSVQKYDLPLPALMSSLMALSTATQNAFCVKYGPHNVAMNLYCIVVAPSGSGKDAGRKTIREIGGLVGDLCLGGKVASEAGLYDALAAAGGNKTLLWDEIWSLFSKLGTAQSANEQAMVSMLMEMATGGSASVSGPALSNTSRAQREPVVYAPFLNFLGSTTKGRLMEAMSDSFLEDGLIGRTIFAVSAKGAEKPVGYSAEGELPDAVYQALTDAVTAFYKVGPKFAEGKLPKDQMHRVRGAGPAPHGRGYIGIRLSHERACRIDQWTRDMATQFVEDTPIWTAVNRQISEQTIKIAGLMAVGKLLDTAQVMDMTPLDAINDFGVAIEDDCIDFAIRLMEYIVAELRKLAGDFEEAGTAASLELRTMQKKVMAALRDPAGAPKIRRGSNQRECLVEGWLPKAYHTRLLGGTPSSRNACIENLMAGEYLSAEAELPKKLQTEGKVQSRGWRLIGGI